MATEAHIAKSDVWPDTGDRIQVKLAVTLTGEPKVYDVEDQIRRLVESVMDQITGERSAT